MTWSKLSDDFADDCDTLTDAAFRLHVEGLCWSNRKLLDCRVPKRDLRRFASADDAPAVAAELVAVGWWTDDGDAYVIRHHASYQRSREQVVALQERNQRNGKAGGRPSKSTGVPREQAPPRETQMATEVETQRDGTGQDRQLHEPPTEACASASEDTADEPAEDWPSTLCTTSGHHGCGWQTRAECRDCCDAAAA